MTIVYRQSTYKIPGTYQWVKPSTAAGAGPFGSTYLETIITTIGGGMGGDAGDAAVNFTATSDVGGIGGAAGCYINATYLPSSLNSLEDIVVGNGIKGAPAVFVVGTAAGSVSSPQLSSVAGTSRFGLHMSAAGAQHAVGGSGTITGGLNVTNQTGAFPLANAVTAARNQLSTQLGVGNTSLHASYYTTGNNAGGAGGNISFNGVFLPAGGGNGGAINFQGAGVGSSSGGTATGGGFPGAGGGACAAQVSVSALKAGDGANAINNTGSGGGGGGTAITKAVTTGGNVTSGAGGNGSDGVVQVTDIFTLPPVPTPYVFNLEIIAWYHMMNQARPISLTGRYQS